MSCNCYEWQHMNVEYSEKTKELSKHNDNDRIQSLDGIECIRRTLFLNYTKKETLLQTQQCKLSKKLY